MTQHVDHTHAESAPGQPAAVAAVNEAEVVAYDPFAERRWRVYRAVQAIYLVFGIIEGLVAIRFILKALGANPNAGFSEFIYGLSAPFVAPFVGLFSSPTYGASVLELHSIVAILVYALLAWLLAKLVWLLFGEARSAVKTRASKVDTHVIR
jgi:hypothetical protein